MYVIDICLFHSMEITGMLYILPTVVLQVKAYLYYETINKTILSFLDVFVCRCVFDQNLMGTIVQHSLQDNGKNSNILVDETLFVESKQ